MAEHFIYILTLQNLQNFKEQNFTSYIKLTKKN